MHDKSIKEAHETVDPGKKKLLQEQSSQNAPKIKSTYSDYPGPLDRLFKNLELTSTCGSYYFVLGPLLTFLVILQELAKEKELKLRQGLNVVGVSHSAYWLSWLLIATVLNLAQTLVLVVAGHAGGLVMWKNVPAGIIF